MNWFLQTNNYNYYGWGVLNDLFQGRRIFFFNYMQMQKYIIKKIVFSLE